MTNHQSTGTAQAKVEKPSWEALKKECEFWLQSEIQNEPAPLQQEVTVRSFWSWFVIGFGNLIEVFPTRKHREIFRPETTVEQDIQEGWREVGRALCEVTCAHEQPSETR